MDKQGILIVEDEGIVAESIKITLENFGYKVLGISSSGPDALEKAIKLKPDLILMDIMLQGPIDGIETACEIKKTFNTAIIFLTAYGDDEILSRAKNADPFGYLLKPFDDRELHGTIEMALQKSMLEKKILHLSGMLKATRDINQKIVKEKNIQELLDFSVNTLTSTREYNSTWIVLHDRDGNITYSSQSGAGPDFDEVLKLLNNGNRLNCYKHSLESKNAYIIKNPQTECDNCPLSKNYLGNNAITIPLISNNINYGVLTISVNNDYADQEELSLLEEVAGDIAFCVYNNELEAKQKISIDEIKESEKRYRLLFDNLIVGIYKTDVDGKIIDCNVAYAHLLGYTFREDLLRLNAEELYYKKEGRKDFLDQMGEVKQEALVETQLKDKNGKSIWLLESVKRIEDNIFQGTVIDITEKKRAEENQQKLLSSLTERVKEMSCLNAINEICQKPSLSIYEILQRTAEAIPFGFLHSEITSARIRLQEYEVSSNNCKETKWFLQEFFHYTAGSRGIIEVFYSQVMPFQEIGPFISEEQNLLKNVATILGETIKRRNAEASLKESQEIFTALTKAAQDGIVMIDDKGMVIYFNEAAEMMFGYAANELIGLPLHEFIAPDKYASQYSEGMTNFHKTGEGPIIDRIREVVAKRSDGTEFPVELSISGIEIKGVWHAVGLVRDITKRKLSEKALVESEERFRGMFDNSTIGIYRTTPDGDILLANPSLLNLLGYESQEDLINVKNIIDIYADTNSRKTFQEILEMEGVIYGHEDEWKRKDGTVIKVRESARTVLNDENEILYYEGVVEDITESKMYESALIEAKEKAEESNRLKSSILTNMSHELRTPLVGIMGFAEVMKSELIDESNREMAGRIFLSGKRLSNTLNAILNLSKIEAGNISVALLKMDPLPIVKKVAAAYEEIVIEKGLYLKVVSKISEFYKIDEDLFEQVLSFLVDNGVKFTETGGITIELSEDLIEDKSYNLVKVIDTGCGIAEKNQKKLFHQFQQLSEGHSRNFEGLGLGLNIASKFVHLMNGKILVESKEGMGSTFTICLPKVLEEDKPAEPMKMDTIEETLPQEASSTNVELPLPSILYVEDDDTNVTVIKMFVRGKYIIDVATNGISALEKVKQNIYDAILMDINLGKGMNGKEVTNEIRKMEIYKNIPIIAVTAFTMEGDKEEFIEAGCSHYLPKPFGKKELIELVAGALQSIE